ncbi:histidine kinase [Pedobacter sp. KR3-3]|uniref:Histidine kinase n=1 Tax=Pedobacter albus TaxID=3113905 RepID=A0ABU7ICC4_9SPHI|nr:histidine kinase [Pedobacter sp. KR3-3]MEE1947127.1 histidine kinase [Pedobacter sp. KR3-3]
MFKLKSRTDVKYFKIELFFFIFICYLGSIISDIEYSFYEENNVLKFTDALEYRLVVGTYSFVFYGIYYWVFLKSYVFRKKTLPILLSIVCFILLSHLYNKYLMNWSIIRLPFVSEKLKLDALKELNRPTLYFIVSYTLNRILFTIIGFTFLIRSLQQDEQLKAMKEQQLLSELAYLKAQLQPHFFFNTLNNIYALALKQSKDTAPLVAKLSEMMRYILYQADQEQVLLKDEIAFVKNYVEVEQIRYRDTIAIQLAIQGIQAHTTISPLLLLPFVENAFKHGVEEEQGEGFVQLVICQTEAELLMEISNSRATGQTKTGGIGLTNVQKRLELLYPKRYKLEQQADEKIYQVRLTLQMK